MNIWNKELMLLKSAQYTCRAKHINEGNEEARFSVTPSFVLRTHQTVFNLTQHETLQNSFYSRASKSFNTLPNYMRDINESINVFKTKLRKYYSELVTTVYDPAIPQTFKSVCLSVTRFLISLQISFAVLKVLSPAIFILFSHFFSSTFKDFSWSISQKIVFFRVF